MAFQYFYGTDFHAEITVNTGPVINGDARFTDFNAIRRADRNAGPAEIASVFFNFDHGPLQMWGSASQNDASNSTC